MSSLSKNIFFNLLGQLLLLILGFVAVKYIFRQLGHDALGIIYFTATVNALLCAVMEMGLCSTSVKEVSSHYNSEPGYIRDMLRTFSLFYWAAYALLALAVYFLAPAIVHRWIILDSMDGVTAIAVLRILGIASLAGLLNSFYTSLFRGLQRMELNNTIDVITTGLQQFGTVFILAFNGNLFHVVYWLAACYGLKLLAYIVFSAHFFTFHSLLPGYSRSVMERVFPFASKMMYVSIVSAIHMQIDKVIVSKLLPVALFGYYGFAYGSVAKGTLIAGSISQAAFPSFSALSGDNDRSTLMVQYRKLQDLVCLSLVPIYAAISFAVLPLFSFLLDTEAAQLLLLPTALLCLGFYLNGTVTVPYVFSLAVGKPEIATRINLYALLFVLPVAVFLIYFLSLVGAALAWVFYHLFYYIYGIPKICRDCLNISVWEWYFHVIRIIIIAGLIYGIAWIISANIDFQSISSLAACYSFASIAFLQATWFIVGQPLRGSLKTFFKTLRIKVVEFV